jgi:chromosome transmission fidelity protein 1
VTTLTITDTKCHNLDSNNMENEASAASAPSSSSSSCGNFRQGGRYPHVYENFTFPPYPQQKQLMDALYACMTAGHVGIFESPTGTGKSLSTLFAAMAWLQEQEIKMAYEATPPTTTSEVQEDDWLASLLSPTASVTSNSSTSAGSVTTKANSRASVLKKLEQVKVRIKSRKGLSLTSDAAGHDARTGLLRSRTLGVKPHAEANAGVVATKRVRKEQPTQETEDAAFIIDAVGNTEGDESEVEDEVAEEKEFYKNDYPQIIFCSRTHSQLAQFVSEIQKCKQFSDVRVCILGGRKNLCIHGDVQKLRADAHMTDVCLKMQKNKQKPDEKIHLSGREPALDTLAASICSYKHSHAENVLSEYALANILDIEDLVSAGHKMHACPYYASRKAMKYAQIVCMPYNFLISEDIRNSIGLNLNGRVVVIDEAHNIIDVCNSLHSAEITLSQLDFCHEAVDAYTTRFQTVFSGKTSYNMLLVKSIIMSLIRWMKGKMAQSNGTASEIVTVNDFVFAVDLDNVNLLQLRRFLVDNNVIHKVSGFMENLIRKAQERGEAVEGGHPSVRIKKQSKRPGTDVDATVASTNFDYAQPRIQQQQQPSQYNSALRSLLDLLRCLTTTNADGRVVFGGSTVHDGDCVDDASVKFVLLNPSLPFEAIVQQSHSVCLLGGTMQPFSYYSSHLLPSLQSETAQGVPAGAKQLHTFTCGHVINPTNVKALTVSVGPAGKRLLLTHNHRSDPAVLDDLFHSIFYICRSVPAGVVVFFTSYAYMEQCIQHWKQCSGVHTWNALADMKHIFTEPKQACECEGLLNGYAKAINSSCSEAHANKRTGAVLFSVMGGKLSEGINFADSLARCVCVLGLPYPDKRDPILQLKLNYYANQQHASAGTRVSRMATPVDRRGAQLYDVLCMRSVNQSIGRAIRHANDYATMVLIDERYCESSSASSNAEHASGPRKMLPGWISDEVVECRSFEQCLHELHKFFSLNR